MFEIKKGGGTKIKQKRKKKKGRKVKKHLNGNAMIVMMMKENWLKCQMQEKIVGMKEVKKVNQMEKKREDKKAKKKCLK